MRLIEPLQGFKLMGGHYLFHLASFVAMIMDIAEKGPKWWKELQKREKEAAAALSVTMDDELPMSLLSMRSMHHRGDVMVTSGGGGEQPDPLTPTEIERQALTLYYMLTVAHGIAFSFMILSMVCKNHRNRRHFFAQFASIASIAPYGACLYYVVWLIKFNWSVIETKEIHRYEAWIIIEVCYHFFWLLACSFFMLICYLFKIKPFIRLEQLMEYDEDPWNNRDTSDFLKHLVNSLLLFIFMKLKLNHKSVFKHISMMMNKLFSLFLFALKDKLTGSATKTSSRSNNAF